MRMKINQYNFIIVILLTITSCANNKEENKNKSIQFNDESYVLDSVYNKNDARRYGLTANTANLIHPKTNKTRLETVLDIAEKSGEEMLFSSGFYRANLVIRNRKNLKLRFKNSEFGLIHFISPDTSEMTSNIEIKGTLIGYGNLGIISSQNIKIDTVIIQSDTLKNPWKKRATGAHIYKDTRDVEINHLEIHDLGSGSDFYKNAHAALCIDGGAILPENIRIRNLVIESSDRHGIYITGRDHLIDNVVINNFGKGSSNKMTGIPHANNDSGEHKEFKALWVNKCYDSFIESIIINEKDSKAKYTAHFDAGDKTKPFIIGKLKVLNDNPQINILEEESSGVIIEIKD